MPANSGMMTERDRFRGTRRHVYAHWPTYFLVYGGIVLALVIIGVSARRGWWAFLPLGLLLLILFTCFLFSSLWVAHQLYDRDGLSPHHILFDMAQIQATDRFVLIEVGSRYRAIELSHRLTTGQVITVDIYSPQWMPSRALSRWRAMMSAPAPDPRIEWHHGDISLLPLPDQSVEVVMLCHVMSEFWQRGDQLRLLKEVDRILTPEGHVLMAERTRTGANWALVGPAAIRLLPAGRWRDLLAGSGFVVRSERGLNSIVHCFRADKPSPSEGLQLTFDLPS